MNNPFYPPATRSIFDAFRTDQSPLSQPNPFGTLAGLGRPSALDVLGLPLPATPATSALVRAVKRKVYFAFDFDDLIRVNNVRQVGKIGPCEQRNPRTFYDRSIWESRDIKKEENLKALMRNAVQYSSAVCVLIGTKTWQSRWVKYEIARAVIDQRGLLAVHLNGINHHQRKAPDRRGINPLHFMGVCHAANGNFYLYEKQLVVTDPANSVLGFEWRPYEDFMDPVPLPRYMSRPAVGYVMPLAVCAQEYDMASHDGFKNIGAWIDAAATQVGR